MVGGVEQEQGKPSPVHPEQAFRYPGGKGKIGWDIINWFSPRVVMAYMGGLSCYCEPFVGSGAILSRILPLLEPPGGGTRVVVGDRDVGVCAYWRCIADADKATRLVRRIQNFAPTVECFYQFKEADGTYTGDDVDAGFRKLALHQMSFSGLGVMAGGPIGGRGQQAKGGKKKYDVTCRWAPERHMENVLSLRHQIARVGQLEVVHGDFGESLSRVPADGFAYLDPPYYVQGGALYAHNMTPADHERLAGVLRAAPYEWVLSYDDAPEVKALYPWADIRSFEMLATIESREGTGSRRKNKELVIAPKG